jgi:hypothetical protein
VKNQEVLIEQGVIVKVRFLLLGTLTRERGIRRIFFFLSTIWLDRNTICVAKERGFLPLTLFLKKESFD